MEAITTLLLLALPVFVLAAVFKPADMWRDCDG